jgi:hypothetical protein
VAGRIVALGNEDIVRGTIFGRLVERNGSTGELLEDGSKTIETGLELEVVVAIALGDGRDNGDIVTLRADVVGG